MIDPYKLIDFELNEDKSCNIKDKLAFGDTDPECLYVVRTLNVRDTQKFVKRLSEFIDNYNKG